MKVRIADNLKNMVTEAEDVLQKLKTDVLSPQEAEGVLKDMVGYLSGALKTFLDIAKQLNYKYVGQDTPDAEKEEPKEASKDRDVVGQDKNLDSEFDLKEPKEKRQEVGKTEKVDKVDQGVEGGAAKRKVVGQTDSLEAEKQEPVDPKLKTKAVGIETGAPYEDAKIQKKGSGEVPVIESVEAAVAGLDPFTKELVEEAIKGLSKENRSRFLSLPKMEMIDVAYRMHGTKKK